MYVTYKPEGEPVQTWDFDPGTVRAGAAEQIERRFNGNWDLWRAQVKSGSAKARRVLLWHLLRQTHHTLRYEDTPDFLMSELVVEHSVAELLEIRDRLERAKLDDDEREQMRVALDLEITDAMAREGIEDEADAASPKATSGD